MIEYCELTREQIEAALNFIRHVNQERHAGHCIDTSLLSRVIVCRDPNDPRRVSFEMEFEERTAA